MVKVIRNLHHRLWPLVESISNSSQTLINCGSRGNLSSYKLQPTFDCLHICMISDDSPSEMSIIAVGFISKACNKYERLFELPVSVDALLNKYRRLSPVVN
jgi:hypothetical protein